MPLNIAAFVQSGLATAKNIGVAQTITVTRGASSFTVTAAREDAKPAYPPTGGTSVAANPKFTVAAADCDFAPAFGDLVTDQNGAEYRVLARLPIVAGPTAVAYTIEVAG